MIEHVPLWLAIVVSICLVTGALLTMAGCVGLLRLSSFYQRIHSPTMGTSMGGGLILFASALYFTVTRERLIVHEIAIFLFVTVTTPVTLMLLARATLFRDRVEGKVDVPRLRRGDVNVSPTPQDSDEAGDPDEPSPLDNPRSLVEDARPGERDA